MTSKRSKSSIFSLVSASRMLPTVKRLTAEAVNRTETVVARMEGLSDEDPGRAALAVQLEELVNAWVQEVRGLGVEVKGLWLVDFDTGDGYYCWAYPEEAITHYHGYEDGFAGRMKIV